MCLGDKICKPKKPYQKTQLETTHREQTKQTDAILIAHGKLRDINVTVGAQNFSFIGGSLGAAAGEALIHGIQHAIDNKNPFVFF